MYDDLTYAINGACFKVYNTLGNIWQEDVYERAVLLELHARGIRAVRQQEFEVFYFDQRVGSYRLDVLVEDNIILELKAVPEILPIHRAQLLSYLKGYDKPLGLLANFGGSHVEHYTLPKQAQLSSVLTDRFDFDQLTLKEKHRIKNLLFMANRILITLGTGYLHQVYRRAFYHELKTAGCSFEVAKQVVAQYQQQAIGTRDVNFLIVGDLLLSVVAVNDLNAAVLLKFRNYLKYFRCPRGLIVNFHATVLDFRYIEV